MLELAIVLIIVSLLLLAFLKEGPTYIVAFNILFVGMLFLIAALEEAEASTFEVGATFSSYHWDRSADRNEENPGLWISSDNLIAGVYKNSYSDPTVFAGYHWDKKFYRNGKFSLKADLALGTMYGYGLNPNTKRLDDADKWGAKLLPYAMPTLSAGYDDWHINSHFIFNSAVGFSISKEFQ